MEDSKNGQCPAMPGIVRFRILESQLRHVGIQEAGALATALAELGRALALVNDARLFEKTARTNLRENAVALHHLAEPPNRGLKGLVVFDDNTGCHLKNHPLRCRYVGKQPASSIPCLPGESSSARICCLKAQSPCFAGGLRFQDWNCSRRLPRRSRDGSRGPSWRPR